MAFAAGFEEIEELDDEHIREQSAESLGIFYLIKGLLRESLDYLNKANDELHTRMGRSTTSPLAPIYSGFCAAYLGQFHRAIGSLDFNLRLALERSDRALACSIRAVLGVVLVLIKKNQNGLLHLRQAQEEAENYHYAFGLYMATAGLAVYHFNQRQMKKAHETFTKAIQEASSAGFIRHFTSPWFLEMLYEFHRLGFEPIPDLEFSPLMERLCSGINVHLKGVALRLRAKEAMIQGKDISTIEDDLAESEKGQTGVGARESEAGPATSSESKRSPWGLRGRILPGRISSSAGRTREPSKTKGTK